MATINITTKFVVFEDATVSSNPALKYVDWTRQINGVATAPRSERFVLSPGENKVVFDGSMAHTIDPTTTFSLSLSTVDPSRYRLTHTGGTAPGFRTSRGLTLSGATVTFAVLANQTVLVTTSGSFAAIQQGDGVFVPHTITGDSANVLSPLNAGYWEVLAKSSSTSITLVRPVGTIFEATDQSVTLTNNNQFRAYSASGLTVDDWIDITGGFSVSARKSYRVLNATDLFVEFISTLPLAAETGVQPSASGMNFFREAKNIVYVEGSQDILVRTNGDTNQRVSPIDPSNANAPGQYFRSGLTWSLNVTNTSVSNANVNVIYME